MKPSTSGRLYYIDTNVLHYLSFNGKSSRDTFLIFPYFWHWPHFLINSSTLSLILYQKNLFKIFCIIESLPQWKVIALVFRSCPSYLWTLLIIVCCLSVEETTSLVMFYINCPWSIEKGLQAFPKLAFLLYLSKLQN